MVFHPGDVTCPAQLVSQNHGLYTGEVGPLQDFYVGDVVAPVDLQDRAEATLVEAFERSEVSAVQH